MHDTIYTLYIRLHFQVAIRHLKKRKHIFINYTNILIIFNISRWSTGCHRPSNSHRLFQKYVNFPNIFLFVNLYCEN